MTKMLGDPDQCVSALSRAILFMPVLFMGGCPNVAHVHVTTAEAALRVIRGGGTAVLPIGSWVAAREVVGQVAEQPEAVLRWAAVRARANGVPVPENVAVGDAEVEPPIFILLGRGGSPIESETVVRGVRDAAAGQVTPEPPDEPQFLADPS